MPTRIILHGNEELANRYRFIAYHLLLPDTLKLMSFQGLAIYRRRVVLEHGIEVVIRVHHGNSMIHITAPFQAAEQHEEHWEPTNVVVAIGSDMVGYHYVLCTVLGQQLHEPKKVDTLQELYAELPYIEQDLCFVMKQRLGLTENDFAELSCSPPECWDEDIQSFEHPIEGTVQSEHTYHFYTSGDWYVYEWCWKIDHFKHYDYAMMPSIYLEKWVPAFRGEHISPQTMIDRWFGHQEDDYGATFTGSADGIYMDTPLGYLACLEGDVIEADQCPQCFNEAPEPGVQCYGFSPQAESYSETSFYSTSNYICPFRTAFRADGFPAYNASDLKAVRAFEARFCDKGMLQAYAVSFWEWEGEQLQGSSTWNEVGRQHIIFGKGACGYGAGDPIQQPRNEQFEQIVKELILHAHSEQLTAGQIDDTTSYRGQVHAYFTREGADMDPKIGTLLNVLSLVNNAREENGLEKLIINFDLEKAAVRQAVDMARNQFMDHTGSDGSTYEDRLADCGFTAGGTFAGCFVGENLATGYRTPQEVFDGWWGSPEHKANILDADYKETALDLRYSEDGEPYWVQVFGYNPNH